jgi:PAS domain S-box-containing protein
VKQVNIRAPGKQQMLPKVLEPHERLVAENADLLLRLEKAEAELRELKSSMSPEVVRPSANPGRPTAAMLHSLIAAAPIGVVVFDADLRYVLVNELLADMNGLTVGDHLGKKFEDVVPNLHDQTGSMFRSVLASGAAVPDEIIEGQTPREPGVTRAWRVSSFPVVVASHHPLGVAAIVQEVTEQRRTEARLREAEATEKIASAKVVALMENLSDGMCVFDPDFRFIYVNAAAERINAMSRLELLGRTQWEVFPACVGTPLEHKFRRAMAERQVMEFENYYAPWDCWYAIKLYPADGGGMCVLYRDITESKRTADSQRTADERLRRVFDNQTVGMIEWNSDRGLITGANSHFLDMVGYSAEDVAAGKLDFRAMTPPEWTAVNEASIAEIRRYGRAPSIEKEYIRKDGTRVPILIAGVRFENSVSEGMSVIIDLTNIKRTEGNLRASEERFRAAVGAVSAIVWTNNAEGMMTGEQVSWSSFTGQDFESYQGFGWAQCVHPDDVQPTVDAWKKSVNELSVFEFEHRVLRRDGKWRDCAIRAVPVFDNAGKIFEWVGVHTDVTKQRQAEAKLKGSEVRYRRLFESAKDGILILDAATATISDANPFIGDMLGYLHDEFLGKELWQIGLFEDIEASKSAVRELQKNGYIRYDDLPLKTRSGQQISVEFVSNMYGEEGEEVIQCNIRDITDRKQLEQGLREQAAELLQADRRKDGFLATLAHELRNPLAPIRNGLQIMRLAGNDPAVIDQSLSMMERQLAQMVHLVDDLLDVSRISRGKLDLRIDRVQLAKIIDSAVETSRPLIDAKRHQLKIELPSQPVYLNADLTRLAQVFSNLLNNAAKYSDPGGQITLTAAVEASEVVVSVKDAGIGIAPDMLAAVFDMFTQVNHSLEKSQGGLGIGLCLVKQLVELHGGSTAAYSEGIHLGSQFVVRLPMAALARPLTEPEDVRDTQPPVVSLNAAGPATLRRILVADDNVDAVESLGLFLTILGNEVRTVTDGLQAVEMAATFQPQVILLDIGMPQLNGYDACRRIRAQAGGSKPFLVALTGWGQDEDRRRSMEAGFDHHLVKPMDPAALEALLDSLQTRVP